MNIYYVYSYTCPGDSCPFYIGKGKGCRWLIHLSPSKLRINTHFYHRLKLVLNAGKSPIIQKIAENLSESQAFDLEQLLIKFYGRLDIGTGCLCNHTDGGEGSSGHIYNESTRDKISQSLLGHSISKETRQKISLANSGRQQSIQHKEKISQALRGHSTNLNCRQKISCALSIPIESYNLETGDTIQRYTSSMEAARSGFHFSHVCACVRGEQRSHRKLGWRKQTNKEQ